MAWLFYLRKRQSDRHFPRKRSLVRSDFSESRGFDKAKTNFSGASFLRLPGMTLIKQRTGKKRFRRSNHPELPSRYRNENVD